jgi:hypothetical protein
MNDSKNVHLTFEKVHPKKGLAKKPNFLELSIGKIGQVLDFHGPLKILSRTSKL